MKNRILLLGLLMLFGVSTIFAQQKEKKKIVIVKEMIDKDGKKTVKKIVKENDETEEFEIDGENGQITIKIEDGGTDEEEMIIIHNNGKDNVKIMKGDALFENINVNVNEVDGEKEVQIRIINKDGEEEVIEWKGDGEIPAEIREKMNIEILGMDDMEKDGIFFFHEGGKNSGFLGVQMESEKGSDEVTDGVEIEKVIENSAAEEAGLEKGDILKKVNGKDIKKMGDVISALDDTKAGDKVEVVYKRNGKTKSTTATLKEREHKVIIRNDFDFDWEEKDGDRVIILEGDEDGKKIIKMQKEKIIIKEMREGDEVEVEVEIEEIPEGQEADFLQEIDIFPNPAEDILKIRFTANKKDTKLRIVDTNGKEIYSKNLNKFDGEFEEEISLKNAARGTLILSIEQGKKIFTEKIILK